MDVDLNKRVFIFSVEHFYSRLTLLLSGLPSAERPGIQPDLTEPVKKPLQSRKCTPVRSSFPPRLW